MMCTYHSWQRSTIRNEVTSNSKEILVGGQSVSIKSHGIEIMHENCEDFRTMLCLTTVANLSWREIKAFYRHTNPYLILPWSLMYMYITIVLYHWCTHRINSLGLVKHEHFRYTKLHHNYMKTTFSITWHLVIQCSTKLASIGLLPLRTFSRTEWANSWYDCWFYLWVVWSAGHKSATPMKRFIKKLTDLPLVRRY